MRELAVFSRQFATLVASGMPMLRSLYTLEDQTEDERIKEAIAGAAQRRRGRQLARRRRWSASPTVFDPLFRAMVRSGEGSGRLEEALDRVAFQLEKLDALRRQVRSAMMYPALRLRLRDRSCWSRSSPSSSRSSSASSRRSPQSTRARAPSCRS